MGKITKCELQGGAVPEDRYILDLNVRGYVRLHLIDGTVIDIDSTSGLCKTDIKPPDNFQLQ